MRKDEFPIVDKIREEAYRQGREDAINEFLREMPFAHTDIGDYGEGYDSACQRARSIAEQIKEEKND